MGDVSLGRAIKAEPAGCGIDQSNGVMDLMSAGWTDKSHMLYISSMEASFVDQLRNHGRNANQNSSSGHGFKVLRSGVWEKLNFERTNACARAGGRYRLPANPWIRHFRPRGCSSNSRSDGADISVGDHESGIQTIQGKAPLSHECVWEARKGENLLDDSTEVSDQNFADDEVEVDGESSKPCKKRKLSSTTAQNDSKFTELTSLVYCKW